MKDLWKRPFREVAAIDNNKCLRHEEGSQSEKGVAILIAILGVAFIMIFSSAMIINTQVQTEQAMGQRDQIRAEYLAKSAQNLGIFLIGIDFGLDLALYGGSLGPSVEPTDKAGDIWSLLNGFPISGELIEGGLSSAEKLGLSEIHDEKTIDTLKKFDGTFAVQVEDEGGKINISECSIGGPCTTTVQQLELLFSCPAEKAYLEEKGIVPVELASKIRDWIDTNRNADGSGLSSEDSPYEKASPSYKAKNAPMDTLEELMLIDQWGTDLHEIFSPHLTIYPLPETRSESTKININSASRALLTCLFPNAKKNCSQEFQSSLFFRGSKDHADKAAFANTNSEIASLIQSKFCETDTTFDKVSWFTNRSDTFKITSMGQVGQQNRTLVSIVHRGVADPTKGQKSGFKLLYSAWQ